MGLLLGFLSGILYIVLIYQYRNIIFSEKTLYNFSKNLLNKDMITCLELYEKDIVVENYNRNASFIITNTSYKDFSKEYMEIYSNELVKILMDIKDRKNYSKISNKFNSKKDINFIIEDLHKIQKEIKEKENISDKEYIEIIYKELKNFLNSKKFENQILNSVIKEKEYLDKNFDSRLDNYIDTIYESNIIEDEELKIRIYKLVYDRFLKIALDNEIPELESIMYLKLSKFINE